VFPQVYSFPTVGGVVVQNIEVVATKQDTLVTREELQARNQNRDIGIDLSAQLASYRTDERTGDVPVLRDDKAPVDSLLDPMVGQRYVVEETDANESVAAGRATTKMSGGRTTTLATPTAVVDSAYSN
jgi:hypothetical protein